MRILHALAIVLSMLMSHPAAASAASVKVASSPRSASSAMALASYLGGWWTDRAGYRLPIASGLVLEATPVPGGTRLVVRPPPYHLAGGGSRESLRRHAETLLDDGRAMRRFERMVEAVRAFTTADAERGRLRPRRGQTTERAGKPHVASEYKQFLVDIGYLVPEGESFKHSKMKWVDYDQLSSFPVEDPGLEAKLRDISARFFVELGGASFGRCDIRVDRRGTPYMLEINPNCGVYYPPTDPGSADLCLLRDPEGHEGFTRLLVRAALKRNERRRLERRVGRLLLPAPEPDSTE